MLHTWIHAFWGTAANVMICNKITKKINGHKLFILCYTGLIQGLRPANERRRYKVTPSLIGWMQTWNQPCYMCECILIVALCNIWYNVHVIIHSIWRSECMSDGLTHWGRNDIGAILQTTFSNAFYQIKMCWFLWKISLKFIPKGPINNIPALVQIMAWRRPGDKPLLEPMMDILLNHICVTWPQWVNELILPDAEHGIYMI